MQTKPTFFFLTVFLTVLLFLPLIHPAFATTIFSDGFESGDFSAWTGTVGTPTVVSTQAHHGTYSMNIDGTKTLNQGCYKSITPSDGPIYARLYVYFAALSSAGNYMDIIQIVDDSGWGEIARVINNGTNVIFCLYNNYYNYALDTDAVVATGQWYCVELVFYRYPGQSKLYIDGVLKATDTGNNPNIQATRVYACGLNHYYFNAYFDCVVVADAYIGPETAGQEYSFTLTETAHATATLNIQQEHGYAFTGTVTQTSILQYGVEARQTLTQTVTSSGTTYYWMEQLYTFPQTTTLQTTLTYAAELAEVFIVNIETINPQGNIYYWIEEFITPLDWSMIAIGLAALAFVIAAAAIALK